MASLHVMIVEDEPLIAMAMQMLIEEDLGGVVLGPFPAVGPALAAIKAAKRIDVALLDCNLGKTPSWPVADALATRGAPFAFTSGQGMKDIPERFAGRPAFAKPVEDEQLRVFLRQFVDGT